MAKKAQDGGPGEGREDFLKKLAREVGDKARAIKSTRQPSDSSGASSKPKERFNDSPSGRERPAREDRGFNNRREGSGSGERRPERRSDSGFGERRTERRGDSPSGFSRENRPERGERTGGSYPDKRRPTREGGEGSAPRGNRFERSDRSDRGFSGRSSSSGEGFRSREGRSDNNRPDRRGGERPSRPTGEFRSRDSRGPSGDSRFRKRDSGDSNGGFSNRRDSGESAGGFARKREEGDRGDRPFRPKPSGFQRGERPSRSPRPERGAGNGRTRTPSGERGFKGRSGDDAPRERRSGFSAGLKPNRFLTEGGSRPRPNRSRHNGPSRKNPVVDARSESDDVRLNRYIANSGVCSRREADELIRLGMISVNGKIVTEMGYKVNPGDSVKYGKRLLSREKPVYLLLNKPKDFLTTTDDPEGRKTVLDLVKGFFRERLYPVGRLDRNSTGLLLLTNDGELAEKLTHPSYNVKKIYQVELDKPISDDDAKAILAGVMLEEGKAVPDSMAVLDETRRTVGIEIHIGWNRVVRRMFEAKGYQVEKLDRVMYGGLTKKDLPRGKWRLLTEQEVVQLKFLSK